jgi:hypothetical protein
VTGECDRLALNRQDFQFSRRAIREALGWNDTQLRMHLDRLVSLEYVLVHRGGRGQQFVYELLYDGQGQDGQLFVMGLIDVTRLGRTTTPTSRGETSDFAPSTRAESGPVSPGSRTGVEPYQWPQNGHFEENPQKNTPPVEGEQASSNTQTDRTQTAQGGTK